MILFLFPLVVLSPDIAINFIKKLYYPTPTDILCYNELDFKESQKQIKIQQLRETVDPFNDENINIKALGSQRDDVVKESSNNIASIKASSKNQKIISPSNYKANELKIRSNNNNKAVSESELIMKKNKDQFTEPNEYLDKIQQQAKSTSGKGKTATPIRDKKKESVFIDDDFEMMEGKS